MLIRTKQIRSNHPEDGHGSDIILGKGKNAVTLRFRPLNPERPTQDHCCEVEDPQHIAALLAIPSGFELHPSEVKKGKKAPAPSGEKEEGDEGSEGDGDASPDDMSRAELLAAVEKKTGKKPNPATATAKLRELLKQ